MIFDKKVVVIDNGTGYTKMGWAGNPEPTYDIPTCIADCGQKSQVQVSKNQYDQLDFYIGNEATNYNQTHQITYPIRSGIISDWGLMEKFWHRCIFDYIRCEPEETIMILTEPPMNPPENRENIAEIMFETFNVKGLHIGVQAVLALYSNYFSPVNEQQKTFGLTGTVLDSGDGVTHIIPVSDGYVIGSCIKHIPLAGRDISKFMLQLMKDRGEKIPIEDQSKVIKQVKEQFGYLVKDGNLVEEFQKFDKKKEISPGVLKPSLKFKQYTFDSIVDKKSYTIDIGYERFLGPEMFFHPEFLDARWRVSIDEAIDNAIQQSPIDTRRSLYSNIVLSGGSTLFENFPLRLQEALQKRVNDRLIGYKQRSGKEPAKIEVQVAANPFQRFAVWQGGSMLATHEHFNKMVHTRQEYLEYGPVIARHNPVFLPGM